MSAKGSVIKQLSSLYLVRDKVGGSPGSTTLNGAVAAGASTITVTSSTNFSDGDFFRLGEGEEMELCVVNGAPAGNVITLADNTAYAHADGVPVVEQTAYDLGDVTDGGVNAIWSGESTDFFASTQRFVFVTLNGYVSALAEWALPHVNIENFAHAVGALLSRVRGTAVLTDPKEFTTDGSEFGEDVNMSVIAIGTKFDGTIIRAELWGVDMDYTNISLSLSRGTLSPVNMRAVAGAGGAAYSSALPAATVPDVSITPTNGKVFDALTEVGVMVDGASSGAVASGGTAGTKSITLGVGEGAGFAQGDWVRFGSGSTVEFHQVESVATDTLTMRTNFYRNIAAATAVQEQVPTSLGGIAPAGVTLNIAGTITRLRDATSRLEIGARPGNAQVSMTFGMIEVILANLAYALGIDQAQITGGRLPIHGGNLGLTQLDGVYLTGVLVDGTNFRATCWGNNLDIAQVNLLFNNSGDASAVPITLKPTSGLQLLNW